MDCFYPKTHLLSAILASAFAQRQWPERKRESKEKPASREPLNHLMLTEFVGGNKSRLSGIHESAELSIGTRWQDGAFSDEANRPLPSAQTLLCNGQNGNLARLGGTRRVLAHNQAKKGFVLLSLGNYISSRLD
ncbi:unnamed protein product [Protopolystoma xenopodis]|uniref:Uncharacterized protein n=1 Tax=Protopolystoma xenopodis TaxID=117903 RepID=A0A3S5AVN8_9PLAT|nr:unnamed protein product [Protopolystoma xenopodis]